MLSMRVSASAPLPLCRHQMVLDAKGTPAPIQIIDETNAQSTHVRRLVISRSNVIAPDFKVLLFPHLAD